MAHSGKSRDATKPYIDIDRHLQQTKGLPARLPTLGALECYQLDQHIQSYLLRAAEDPTLLVSVLGWRECYKVDKAQPWTQLYAWWGEYNEWVHCFIPGTGGVPKSGRTAGNIKTECGYWEATRDSLLEQAQMHKNDALFHRLCELFCTGYATQVKGHDFGWIGRLEICSKEAMDAQYYEFMAVAGIKPPSPKENSVSTVKANKSKGKKRKARAGSESGISNAEQQKAEEEVLNFRKKSKLFAAYSRSEACFGMYKQNKSKNPQIRSDGLAAQMGAQQNGTFKKGSFVNKLDSIAQKTGRKLVTSMRDKVRAELQKRRAAYLKRRREARDRRVEEQMLSWQTIFSERLVQWDVDVPTLEEYTNLLAQEGKKGEKEAMTKTAYHAVIDGWSYSLGKCNFSCKDKKKRCNLGCKQPMNTGFAKDGHMQEHMITILTDIKKSKIKRTRYPDIPELPLRPSGNATLGALTDAAHKNTQYRKDRYNKRMLQAKLDPVKYSRIAPLPHHGVIDKRLEGRQIEMTLHLEAEDKEAYPDGYVHCLEGKIVFVEPQAPNEKLRSVRSVRTKWAVATIEWDEEIGLPTSSHPLNVDLYEKQDGNNPKHQGWHLLNEEYIGFIQRQQRDLLVQHETQKK